MLLLGWRPNGTHVINVKSCHVNMLQLVSVALLRSGGLRLPCSNPIEEVTLSEADIDELDELDLR